MYGKNVKYLYTPYTNMPPWQNHPVGGFAKAVL